MLVVKLLIKEGKIPEFKEIIKPLVEASRQESGCLQYDLSQSLATEHEFWLLEEYVDAEALQSHRNTDHYKTIGP